MSVTVTSEQKKMVTWQSRRTCRGKKREREQMERKGGKRRYRPLPFGSKRNSEGVFCGGEGCLPRDHGASWWGCRRAKGPAGPRRSWTAKGEEGAGMCIWGDGEKEGGGVRGEMQQQQQLSLPVPPFVLP